MTDAIGRAHEEYVRAATEGIARDDNAAYVALDTLGVTLLAEFAQAVLDRREIGQRRLMDLRQYRRIE